MKRLIIAISVLACCLPLTGCTGLRTGNRLRIPKVVLPALGKWQTEQGMAGVTDILGAPDDATFQHSTILLYVYNLTDGSRVVVERDVNVRGRPISHAAPGTVFRIQHICDSTGLITVYYDSKLWEKYSNKTQEGIGEELAEPSE